MGPSWASDHDSVSIHCWVLPRACWWSGAPYLRIDLRTDSSPLCSLPPKSIRRLGQSHHLPQAGISQHTHPARAHRLRPQDPEHRLSMRDPIRLHRQHPQSSASCEMPYTTPKSSSHRIFEAQSPSHWTGSLAPRHSCPSHSRATLRLATNVREQRGLFPVTPTVPPHAAVVGLPDPWF